MPNTTTRQKFRLPALLTIISPLLLVAWYYLNTDKPGSVLFGEELHYCNVIGREVSRMHFLYGAVPLVVLFTIGLFLIIIRSLKSEDTHAKN